MLEYPQTISYDKVKQTINNISDTNDQSLAALAYATGSRVSELNKIKKKDFFQEPEGKYLFIWCLVLKKRRKGKTIRKAVVRMDETWLITPILNKLKSMTKDEEILFNHNRMYIYRHLVKVTGWNPHGFRKLRATHLRKNFGFDAYQLRDFFEWSSIEPSGYYVKLDNKEILY
jgi:integrase